MNILKKWWFWVIIVLIVIFLGNWVISFFGGIFNIGCGEDGDFLSDVQGMGNTKCCDGLNIISFYCKGNIGENGMCTSTFCGDDVCEYPEDICNCEEDCEKEDCIVDDEPCTYPEECEVTCCSGDYHDCSIECYNGEGNDLCGEEAYCCGKKEGCTEDGEYCHVFGNEQPPCSNCCSNKYYDVPIGCPEGMDCPAGPPMGICGEENP